VALSNVDMAGVGGLWIPCAGTLTEWNTHLGGEEFEPDAKHFEAKPLEAMNLYLGTPGRKAAEGGANPYDYGHPVEVKVDEAGGTRVAKHYAMGRLSFELADILPDGRTAYIGDDGKDVGLFLFVADRRADLSAGTLYAARWRQTSASDGGAADLDWIRLGHATDEEVKRMIRGGVRFSDIFETSPQAAEGFRPVYVYTGTGGKTALEYLKLKPGMEQAAAFLETRRYAAYLGATTEFTKMEGQTHNAKEKKLYTAISYVEGGMVEGGNGERPRDDIRLAGDPKALACGAVYQSDLRGGVKDSDGRAIDSDWVATSMKALLTGAKKPADQTAYGRYDKCDTDRVANPDNLKYSAALDTLFIGEDSGNHLNNFLWAYRVGDGRLTRIASAPIGAEWTGLQVVENLNGFAYVMANIQHPGAAKDLEKYPPEVRDALREQVDQRGVVGYLGVMPAVK
ncbi:MAG: PhoX family phosphatase, partial [Sulfuricellaceae bacterium]